MPPYPQTNRRQSNGTGVTLPPRPVIYSINTWLWLRELSRFYGRSITLADIPAEVWDWLDGFHFDAVWLFGIWERSPASAEMLRNDAERRKALAEILPDLSEADIVGWPTSVRRYAVDPTLGGPEGLAAARAELARRGMCLILDYMPNHVATDHPWVVQQPGYFIHGEADDLAGDAPAYFRSGDAILAHGRDPNFPPWRDTAQLNAFNPAARAAIAETLCAIAEQCDAVFCQLTMLMANGAFAATWGERAGPPPAEEFWHAVLAAARAVHPSTTFLAEVYWDMEWEMLQQGFDYSYDKRLYDWLAHEGVDAVRGHLLAEVSYQERLVRFVENPYEARAATAFPASRALVAAIAAYTLPGAKMFHQGQFEGFTTRLPVSLARRPDEPIDHALQAFYRRLVLALQTPALRDGHWRLCALNGWPDNYSYTNLLAWCWESGDERRIIVVNLSPHTSQARLQLPWPDLAGQHWVLEDIMEERLFERAGDELLNMGLFVELAPWGRHFFAIR